MAPDRPAPTRAAVIALTVVVSACASIPAVDPRRDDGSAAFAVACVGVLAAERAATGRHGAEFSIEGHLALNEWMFQASRRSSLLDDEIGRAAERRRWAETLSPTERAGRVRTCSPES